jgi:tetratricopeptide (TPR) repeat protein
LTLQAEIAREVSDNLRRQLTSADRQPEVKRYTDNIEAYRAYLQGRYFWNKRNKEGFEKAIRYFGQAIAIDPNYALAYAGLADCHQSMAAYGLSSSKEGFLKAKDAAKRALTIDGTLAEAHTSLANAVWLGDWNWAEAEKGFKRAIELDPNYPTAHHWYAVYLSAMARHEEALAEIKLAQSLDPLSVVTELAGVRILYFARQYDQVIEQSLKVNEMNPGMQLDNSWLRRAYEQKRLYDKAFDETLKFMSIRKAPPEEVAAFRESYAASGWKGIWRKRLEIVAKAPGHKPVSPYYMAGIYARLGDHDKALEWLQRGYHQHADHLVTLKVDPVFDGMRSDPRFVNLLLRIGIVP